jgi:hypothetical protein
VAACNQPQREKNLAAGAIECLEPYDSKQHACAECVFVDPIGDITVLGCPDDEELGEEAHRYRKLTEDGETQKGRVAIRLSRLTPASAHQSTAEAIGPSATGWRKATASEPTVQSEC